ncbi:MAG: EamA family transporter RarD [Paracoccus sp. (in: a-proteobacteria)]|nr:EamA family transporter RarD [Paracoccus sp. (in: a-proteobacteria)]
MTETEKGVLAMIGVCTVWGLSPIFYGWLSHVPAGEVLAHRTLWSVALFALYLGMRGRLGELSAAVTGPQAGRLMLAALLISMNWGVFIWSVQANRVVESSIGYYIFPLVSVALGIAVLGERVSRAQGFALMLAAAAVVVLTLGLGAAPWVSLALAFSFGFYGLVKKRLETGAVISVAAEVVLLAPFAALWLAFVHVSAATGGFFGRDLGTSLLLIASGAITAIPLILFAYGARRISMTSSGLLFYLNPTLQFLVAVMWFGQPVTRWHVIVYAMIWTALAIYTTTLWRARRATSPDSERG